VPDASAISLPFAKDRSGLIAPPEKGRLKVLLVAPGSPADLAGWKAGNEIIAVDGHSIDAAFSASPVARWNQQPAGTVVSLTRSDHSTHELNLADYY
jgi:predicted metalloprotease with PDZ domain